MAAFACSMGLISSRKDHHGTLKICWTENWRPLCKKGKDLKFGLSLFLSSLMCVFFFLCQSLFPCLFLICLLSVSFIHIHPSITPPPHTHTQSPTHIHTHPTQHTDVFLFFFISSCGLFLCPNRATWGVNVVRLGWMWSGFEPKPGVFDEVYFNTTRAIVNTLAQHGIYAILDMHQDALSSLFCSYDGIPQYIIDQCANKSRHVFPWPFQGNCSSRPWGSNELTEVHG